MEIKRILSRKIIILAAVLLAANAVFFILMQMSASMDKVKLERKNAQKQEYIEGYSDYVEGVIAKSESMTGYSLFADTSSFSYTNLLKTKADYERISIRAYVAIRGLCVVVASVLASILGIALSYINANKVRS